jgi:hypothetical protein
VGKAWSQLVVILLAFAVTLIGVMLAQAQKNNLLA